MADKTTTLKTKTGDNVYPNVIGDNRKNAFVDSSTITHHFYDQTHKVGFQIANETNIKIQNSLQKPAGLTKTKLVGVGTNGQENIEIGDNLTLANGKLSAIVQTVLYNHFVSIINNNNNNTFYFTFQSNNSNKIFDLYDLKKNLSNKIFLCNGHTDSEKAEYISGNGSNVIVGVVDNSDNSTSDINIDSSYSISDDVSPVK